MYLFSYTGEIVSSAVNATVWEMKCLIVRRKDPTDLMTFWAFFCRVLVFAASHFILVVSKHATFPFCAFTCRSWWAAPVMCRVLCSASPFLPCAHTCASLSLVCSSYLSPLFLFSRAGLSESSPCFWGWLSVWTHLTFSCFLRRPVFEFSSTTTTLPKETYSFTPHRQTGRNLNGPDKSSGFMSPIRP